MSGAAMAEVAGPAAASGGEPAQRLSTLLRQRLGAARFEQWFDGQTRWTLEGRHLRIAVGNGFAAHWVRQKLMAEVRSTAEGVFGGPLEITVEASSSEPPPCRPAAPPPAASTACASAGLNGRYRLEDFVVGPGNQLAYHSAVRVAEEARRQFNPLFIHGSCGLGKTHLLQGLCHRYAGRFPQQRCLYLTGEQFTNEFLEALKANRMSQFRQRFRHADLLVIDDAHFFSGKRRTQEEFLHTFNQVETHNRQVVLACDAAPRDLAQLSAALTSRFVSGLVVRVDPPDLPTRLEILRRFAERRGWTVTETLLLQLAQVPTANVRELEGLLLQAVARSELSGSACPPPAGAWRDLQERLRPPAPVAVERIVRVVADYFALPPVAVTGDGRGRLVAAARAAAMYLARRHTHLSYPDIGRAIGRKSHSTAIGACRRIQSQLETGALLDWATPLGSRRQTMREIITNLTAQLRRPG